MSTGSPSNEPVGILLTSKHRLEYLTADDWARLAGVSEVLRFGKEEILIQAGLRPRHLFFILSGKALIESARGVKVAELTEGELCGEMSFLEDTIASARVIAEGEVEALAIEWTALHQLFESNPDLGSRFFHSLAVNLSRRLRRQLSHGRV
jgi:CRP/FNR family transcriptional regulator, cyclic AMP receptor protein